MTSKLSSSWWQQISNNNQPVMVVSPMVDQSELAFRLLCRRYHPNTLCYTPMLHSKRFVNDTTYRNRFFQTCSEDRPLLAQFCGNDADTLIAAAKLIEHDVDGIDLNLGCPENIAKKGNYGSFLLSDPSNVIEIVRKLVLNVSVPVTCKIRMMPHGHHIPETRRGVQGTINFCLALEAVGCSMICVHARDRHNKGPKTKDSDWDALRQIKSMVNIPIIANGNISSRQDVERCLKLTGVDGVMSAEALLCDPSLFSVNKEKELLSAIALDYLELCVLHPTHDFLKVVKPHLFRLLYGLLNHEEEQDVLLEQLQQARDIDACRVVVRELFKLEQSLSTEKQLSIRLSWYQRHHEIKEKQKDGNGNGNSKKNKRDDGGDQKTVQQIRQAKKARKRKWLESGTRMSGV